MENGNLQKWNQSFFFFYLHNILFNLQTVGHLFSSMKCCQEKWKVITALLLYWNVHKILAVWFFFFFFFLASAETTHYSDINWIDFNHCKEFENDLVFNIFRLVVLLRLYVKPFWNVGKLHSKWCTLCETWVAWKAWTRAVKNEQTPSVNLDIVLGELMCEMYTIVI